MGEMVSFASNGHDARGHLALPDSGSGPSVMVIQEWWGLNPQMKGVADYLADQGFVHSRQISITVSWPGTMKWTKQSVDD